MNQENSLLDTLKNEYGGSEELLFHYTTFESACKIWSSNKLKLSNLINMNDPLEFCKPQSFRFTEAIINMKKVMEELQISLRDKENKVRLLCFCRDFYCKGEWDNGKTQNYSSNLTFKGWARSRMWAQYADNHRGVCLVFNKPEFDSEFKKLENSHIKIRDSKISYTNYLSEIKSAMTGEIIAKNHNKNFRHFYLDDERIEYLFQKCEDFRDENEYRFVLIDDTLDSPEKEYFIDFETSLKVVILGERFNPVLKFRLPYNVEQFKISWNCGMPNLIKY